MLEDIAKLIELFAPHLHDHTTLGELRQMVNDYKSWPKAHELFQRIRDKTLAAEERGDKLADCQYLFEEICAKSLYNLSGATEPAPFDADSPYWILRIALSLARCLKIDDSEVLKTIGAN